MGSLLSSMHGAEGKRVAVIGGGLAGLTAAYNLHKQGVDVHLFEAKDRVGGRILTAKIGDSYVELGGQNIGDGGDAPEIKGLIKELGLNLVESQIHIKGSYLEADQLIGQKELGKEVPYDKDQLEKKLSELAKTAANMEEIVDEISRRGSPLNNYLRMRLSGFEGGALKDLSVRCVESLFLILTGGLAKVHECVRDSQNHITLLSVEKGNSNLIRALKAMLGRRVYTGFPVVAISKESKGEYKLTCKNGMTMRADRVIVAIPPPTYKMIDFGAQVMPQEKLDVIAKIKMGENSKIIAPIVSHKETPFENDFVVDQGAVGYTDSAKKYVTLYFSGEDSHFTKHQVSTKFKKHSKVLELGFKQKKIPEEKVEYAKDSPFVTYTAPIGYSWLNDPYIQGSYSFLQAGLEEEFLSLTLYKNELVKKLFVPIDDTLFFAGEHTNVDQEIIGTMEGACESGAKAARMVISSFKTQKKRQL